MTTHRPKSTARAVSDAEKSNRRFDRISGSVFSRAFGEGRRRTKNKLTDLAILGGEPAFPEPLHVGRPNIGDRDDLRRRFDEIFERRWFTNAGPFVQELEERISDLLGVKHCIAMCNGTVALEIAIRALGLTGEVILPSFTFVATAHALQWQEITPVFCDIEPETGMIDPQQLEKLITPRTTGIIGVHLWGRVCNVQRLTQIARKRNLKLMFDAAHAFGCSRKGTMVGSFGEAEVFSFHATKVVNTYEGGAVVTNNDDLAQQIRLMKNFGFVGADNVEYLGTNGKMNELSAAMGLTSLDSMDSFIEKNALNFRTYKEELRGIAGLRILGFNEADMSNYQYVVLEIDNDVLDLNRDELMNVLHQERILARRYFYPACHNMEPYRSFFPHSRLLLPVTEEFMKRVICMPTGTSVSRSDIKEICRIVRLTVENGKEIARVLRDLPPDLLQGSLNTELERSKRIDSNAEKVGSKAAYPSKRTS